MPSEETILVLVDPTKDTHPAMERAVTSVKLRKDGATAKLLILVAVDPKVVNTHDSDLDLTRDDLWVKGLRKSVEDAGLEYSTLVSWSPDWAETVLSVVDKYDVNLTMIPFYGVRKNVLSDEKWQLLRNAKTPVLLVKEGSAETRNTILASVKVQDSNYEELNAKVIARGHFAAKLYGAELHVVNAYSDSMDYPDRAKVVQLANLPNEQVHVTVGDPDKVISEVANEINSDMVMLGTQRRQGIRAALRGNTIEKIVGGLDRDIMMLV